jgi:hypothetical protein
MRYPGYGWRYKDKGKKKGFSEIDWIVLKKQSLNFSKNSPRNPSCWPMQISAGPWCSTWEKTIFSKSVNIYIENRGMG